jgi:hypothetical protein
MQERPRVVIPFEAASPRVRLDRSIDQMVQGVVDTAKGGVKAAIPWAAAGILVSPVPWMFSGGKTLRAVAVDTAVKFAAVGAAIAWEAGMDKYNKTAPHRGMAKVGWKDLLVSNAIAYLIYRERPVREMSRAKNIALLLGVNPITLSGFGHAIEASWDALLEKR